MLSPGSPAPDFTLVSDIGKEFTISKQRGQPLVLYFYPQDDTEGCTIENQEFSMLLSEFEALGVRVAGISPDSLEDHCAFRDKFGLSVPLLADPDHVAIGAFELWRDKTTFGRDYVGLVRTTVLIDAEGAIRQIWEVRRIKGHAREVLEAARALVRQP